MDLDGDLLMWVVYGPAPPYPSNHQAWQFRIAAGGPVQTGVHAVGPLEEVRQYLGGYLGLYRLDRNDSDDPSIVETWT